MLEKPSVSEQPDQSPESLVAAAKKTIGTYNPSLWEKAEWTEQEIEQQIQEVDINDKLAKHELTLLDVYAQNALVLRREAARLVANATEKNRELTPAETEQLRALQLRLTALESLVKTTGLYVQLIEEYETRLKESEVSPDAARDRIVREHAALMLTQAQARIDAAIQKASGFITGEQANKTALAADSQILHLLASQGSDVPGGNPDGILPVFSATIDSLHDEYHFMFDQYQGLELNKLTESQEYLRAATTWVQEHYPDLDPRVPADRDDARDALNAYDPPDGFDTYQFHLKRLAAAQNKSDVFKVEGQENVEDLARLTALMGRFQIERLRATTIRYHFDQAYGSSAQELPDTATSTPKQKEELRTQLASDQHHATDIMEKHVGLVEEDVLNIGFKEKAETLYNEKGRVLIARLAKFIATVETSIVPDIDIPGSKMSLRDMAEQYLLDSGTLYDALGWPRAEDGTVEDWSNLTDEHKQAIIEKQQSIEKAILRYRGLNPDTSERVAEDPMVKLKESLAAAKKLRELTTTPEFARFDPSQLIATEEVDTTPLQGTRITADTVDDLLKNSSVDPRVVYVALYDQLTGDWENHTTHYETLLKDMHNVIGIHFDFAQYFTEFKDRQHQLSWLILFGSAAAGVAGLVARSWIKRKVNRVLRGDNRRLTRENARLRRELDQLRRQPRPNAGNAKTTRVPEQAPSAPKKFLQNVRQSERARIVGRFAAKTAGKAAIAWTIHDAAKAFLKGVSRQQLDPIDAATLAIEYMDPEQNPSLETSAKNEERRGLLEARLEALLMQREAQMPLRVIRETTDPSLQLTYEDLAREQAQLAALQKGIADAAGIHAHLAGQQFPLHEHLFGDPDDPTKILVNESAIRGGLTQEQEMTPYMQLMMQSEDPAWMYETPSQEQMLAALKEPLKQRVLTVIFEEYMRRLELYRNAVDTFNAAVDAKNELK
jgi:hypothetical protein